MKRKRTNVWKEKKDSYENNLKTPHTVETESRYNELIVDSL